MKFEISPATQSSAKPASMNSRARRFSSATEMIAAFESSTCMRSILDHERTRHRTSARVLPANWLHISLLTKDVDAVLFIHSGHENERQPSGDPHEHWGGVFKLLIILIKQGAHFLIVKRKTLSKNQLTAPLYKLCTQLSTKIVDSFLQLDCRMQRLSSASVFLSPSLLRLSMRFKVARIFKCPGVESATYHRSGRMADLAFNPVLDRYPRHYR